MIFLDCKDCIYIKNLKEKIDYFEKKGQEKHEVQEKQIEEVFIKLERGNKRFEKLETNEAKQSVMLETIINEQKGIKNVLIKIAWGLVGFVATLSLSVISAYIVKMIK